MIDGELVAIGKDGVSHFQLLQNALRHEAKLLYCAFDLMFENAADLRNHPLLERKKRLKAILPRDKLIAFSHHRKANGMKFFAEAERKGLEGVMAKRADSAYASGSRTADWLKIKTAKRRSGDRGLHGAEAYKTILRRPGPRRAGRRHMALYRTCWHWLQPQGLEDLHAKLVKLTIPNHPSLPK